MVSSVNIKETIEDKKSWFNIKRFSIGGVDFQNPEKSLDVKNLEYLNYLNLKTSFKFFEATKIVKNFGTLLSLYKEDDEQIIDAFFCKRKWLSTAPNVINFTFDFNPFNSVQSIDKMNWFFNQYYPYSKLLLTVPNVRVYKTINKKRVRVIDFENYVRFVDESYKILNDKNNKPIFVPISMKMGLKELTQLIEHYLKMQRYNLWFDFEGRPINENTLGRLRHIFTFLKDNEAFDNVVSYFTNIRREKLSNSNEITSVPSDALCAIAGANLIGVNREPQRYKPKSDNQEDATVRAATPVDPSHKARIFNRETYYYVKTANPDLFDKKKYVPLNAARLNAEFTTQSEHFLEHHDIESLLSQKSMFKDEKAGNMLKELTSKSSDPHEDITDFL